MGLKSIIKKRMMEYDKNLIMLWQKQRENLKFMILFTEMKWCKHSICVLIYWMKRNVVINYINLVFILFLVTVYDSHKNTCLVRTRQCVNDKLNEHVLFKAYALFNYYIVALIYLERNYRVSVLSSLQTKSHISIQWNYYSATLCDKVYTKQKTH